MAVGIPLKNKKKGPLKRETTKQTILTSNKRGQSIEQKMDSPRRKLERVSLVKKGKSKSVQARLITFEEIAESSDESSSSFIDSSIDSRPILRQSPLKQNFIEVAPLMPEIPVVETPPLERLPTLVKSAEFAQHLPPQKQCEMETINHSCCHLKLRSRF